tara:strand:+ start:3115 stop:3396 length:282 start_codon:yes stop_codon:yes gene_type:complete
MEVRNGQILRFKKEINISVWVDCLLPAGQMGFLENYVRIKINSMALDIPVREVENLFVDAVEEDEKGEINSEPEVVIGLKKPRKKVVRKKEVA